MWNDSSTYNPNRQITIEKHCWQTLELDLLKFIYGDVLASV